MGAAGLRWLAGVATLLVAIGLALLLSSPLLATAALSTSTRLSAVVSCVAMVAAAWLAATAPTARARAVVTPLLAVAMICPILVGWVDGPTFVRAAARACALLVVPLVLHLLLTGLDPIRRRALRVWLRVSYGTTIAVAIVALVARDAFYDIRCWADCDIPPLVAGLPLAVTRTSAFFELGVTVVGLVVGIAGTAYALLGRRRIESPAIVASALATLGVFTVIAAFSLAYGPASDRQISTVTILFVAGSMALTVLASSIAAASLRLARRARRVERLAEDLGRVSEAGSVEAALTELLDDDTLTVRFPFGADGDRIDATGRLAAADSDGNRTQVEIRRGGRAIAFVDADADRVDPRALTDGLGSAARIAIDNERLRAEILAHLAELRVSRERIVEAADVQRRRTEQDLHDGAQSGLVGLLYTLTARSRSRRDEWTKEDAALLEDAASALREVVATVREIAHGVYPADLEKTGLEEAVRSLTERAPSPVQLTFLIESRPPARVERLAYLTAKRLLETDGRAISLTISCTLDQLRLVCSGRTIPEGLSDRVAALSGTLRMDDDVIVLEIPCA